MMSNNPVFLPGHVVEVRALGEGSLVHSGYYSDIDQMEKDVEALDCTGMFKGIYTTLNMIDPELLSRKANRISRFYKGDSSTGDGDIIRRVWLPVDIDPTRPAGISSTDEEHDKALIKVGKIKGFLSEIGWPEPIVADSGNGAHLLYRIDLPNNDESTLLVKNCLTTLHQFFSDGESEVDLSVYNASRIWKMYGTVSRKGDNTDARPHRRSAIVSVPHDIQVVPVAELMHLSSMMSPVSGIHTISGIRPTSPTHPTHPTNPTCATNPANPTAQTIDLGDWLLAHGIGFEEKPYHGGRLLVLDDCPFSGAHSDGAYAIQFDNGAIFAGCHHNSCGGGEQRWAELRERFDGPRVKGTYEERRRESIRQQARAKREFEELGCVPESLPERPDPDPAFVPEPVPVSPDIALEATRILREGDPIRFMLDTFAAEHVGDLAVAKCLALSMASRSVINSKGLHVLVTGISGKGKSHTFDTMIKMSPKDQRLGGRMSDKALFYSDDLTEGSIICLDDVGLSDSMQEILKGITTSFQNEFIYRTVDKDRTGVKKIIPKRCIWWVAKMEGTGDDQVWNRMLTCWIDDSKEQDKAVLDLELEAAAEFPTGVPGDSREMQICQQIWQQVQVAHVIIPYAKRIRFSSISNRRNPGMLLDMIRSIAILNQHQRERALTPDGMPVIYATIEDFDRAVSIYIELTEESGSQEEKFTKNEYNLIRLIRTSGRTKVTRDMLRGPLARSDDAIRKALHGYPSHGKIYSGLIEKCPALGFFDGTYVDEDGVNRRVRYYTWDEGLYLSWLGGTGIWLASEDEGSPTFHDDGQGPAAPGGKESSGSSPEADRHQKKTDGGSPERESKDNKIEFSSEEDTRKQNSNSLERDTHTPTPIHDPGVASGEGGGTSSEGTDLTDSTTSDDMAGEIFPPGASGLHPASNLSPALDPSNYTACDGVKVGPCSVCGKKWVTHLEKGYEKKSWEDVSKLCRKCHSVAVARVVMSHTTLPGMVDVPNLIPVRSDLGRCKVCGQGRIEWMDKERGVYLCELCRVREMNRGGMKA